MNGPTAVFFIILLLAGALTGLGYLYHSELNPSQHALLPVEVITPTPVSTMYVQSDSITRSVQTALEICRSQDLNDQTMIGRQEEDIKQLHAHIAALTEKLNSSSEMIDHLETDIARLREENMILKSDTSKQQQDYAKLEASEKELKQQLDQTKQELDLLQKQLQDSTEALNKYKQLSDQAVKEWSSEVEKTNRLEKIIQERDKTIADLEEKVNKYQESSIIPVGLGIFLGVSPLAAMGVSRLAKRNNGGKDTANHTLPAKEADVYVKMTRQQASQYAREHRSMKI